MPGAGFYAIQASHIRFGKDGHWYADGEVISNPHIADLFSRHLQRQPDGTYAIRMADERAVVEIEDTPFVVTRIDLDSDFVRLTLNDQSTEHLDPASLRVGSQNVLYCQVKNGTEPARFLRSAYYQMAPHIEETRPGHFALSICGLRHAIRLAAG